MLMENRAAAGAAGAALLFVAAAIGAGLGETQQGEAARRVLRSRAVLKATERLLADVAFTAEARAAGAPSVAAEEIGRRAVDARERLEEIRRVTADDPAQAARAAAMGPAVASFFGPDHGRLVPAERPAGDYVASRIEALLLAEREKIIAETIAFDAAARRSFRFAGAAGVVGAAGLLAASFVLRDALRQRRLSEEELRAERERLQGVLGSTRDVGWSFRGELEDVVFVGGDVAAVYGRSAEALRRDPESYAELVHPDDRAKHEDFRARMRRGESGESLVRLALPQGVRHVLHRWKPRRLPDGRYAIDGITTDVSELKRREEELELAGAELARLNADLEARVAARTEELAERNSELELFSYSVSHDLRAPVRSLEGFACALLEDEGARLSPAGRGYVERIAAAARRMDALIGDILAYGRIARAELRPERVDLGRVVEAELRAAESEIRRTAAVVDAPGPWSAVAAHPVAVGQIVANLLQNALKFTPPGTPPDVRLSTERRGERVRFRCEDRGIGVPPEHRERIFGMLERLHGAETYPGTGVGLAIVRKAARRSGGDAGCEPRPGGGSVFWAEFPAAEAAASV